MSFLDKIFDGAVSEAFKDAGNWLSGKDAEVEVVVPFVEEVGVREVVGCYVREEHVLNYEYMQKLKFDEPVIEEKTQAEIMDRVRQLKITQGPRSNSKEEAPVKRSDKNEQPPGCRPGTVRE